MRDINFSYLEKYLSLKYNFRFENEAIPNDF